MAEPRTSEPTEEFEEFEEFESLAIEAGASTIL